MIPIAMRIAFLRKINIFHDLTDRDLASIADENFLVEKCCKAGEQIVTQGGERDSFFLIFSGRVKVTREHNGKQITLAILVSGDYFGDPLSTHEPNSASISAIDDTTLLSFSRSNIETLSRQFQEVRSNLQLLLDSRKLAQHVRFEWLYIDEVVHFLARKHYVWLIENLMTPTVLLIISIALGVWSGFANSFFILAFSIAATSGIIFWGTWKVIDWRNSYYFLTSQRIIALKKVMGIYVSRQEALLNAILAIDSEIDSTGRVLDYGKIVVRTFVSKIEFTHIARLNQTMQLITEHWLRSKQNDNEEDRNILAENYRCYMDGFELIEGLKQQLSELPYQDTAKLDALRRRAEMIIRNLFGPTSKYLDDLKHISFHPMIIPSSEASDMRSWKSGREEMENLFNTMEEELKLFQDRLKEDKDTAPKQSGNQIFIVHGHDEEMKQLVARVITRLELDPIILHEKPNRGRTIIEKFTDYANVSFAIVLLSPDDIARQRNDAPDIIRSRARQNVVLELGYFLGKLGRNRVVVLYREEPNFEMPSDYSGVLFIPFDAADRWQFDLVKELKASGFNIDANRLL